jgi:phage regulator Rha-like protein
MFGGLPSPFRETLQPDSKGRERRVIEMALSGYMFLAMGFTGPEAAMIKEDLIREFNDMRAQAALLPNDGNVIPEAKLALKRLDKEIERLMK